jgi:transposase
MTRKTTAMPRVLGCDVGKDQVVVFDSESRSVTELENSPRALSGDLATRNGIDLVVCEATGGYETDLLDAALQAGLKAHRADTRKAKAFIRSRRNHGKSDAIDAEGLTRYGQERYRELPLWQPPTAELKAFRELVRLRADLVQRAADLKRKLKAPNLGPAKPHLRALIGQHQKHIKGIETEIDGLLDGQPEIAERVDVVRAIKGCGPVIAHALIALMPELGSLSRRQAAALAGLAPHPNQSGRNDRRRHVKGGRREIKRLLFIAAIVASRFNPELIAFRERLIGAGKKPIVAIVAVARKLITIINARLREQRATTLQQVS